MSNTGNNKYAAISTTIAPWLSVTDGARAVSFYKAAFDAEEVYHLESPDGAIVSRLSVDGAEFWLSGVSPGDNNDTLRPVTEGTIRMILTVTDPDSFFAPALQAGATEVFAVGEEHGWRLGRLVDPFGHHWEIGRQVEEE